MKGKKSKRETYRKIIERIPTGIPGLDKLIEGGFVKDSTIMVRGNTGTCKTIFCLQYLYEGITKFKEPGVYLSFAESKETICQHGRMFGWDFETLDKKEMFAVIRYEPHEVVKIIDEGGGSIRDEIEALGAKRLVIDSLTAYAMLFENRYKANESVLNLFEMLRKWSATTVVTSEFPVSPTTETDERLGFLTDAIINLYNVRNNSIRSRILEIVKMRDTLHSTKLNRLIIDDEGLKVMEGGGKVGKR